MPYQSLSSQKIVPEGTPKVGYQTLSQQKVITKGYIPSTTPKVQLDTSPVKTSFWDVIKGLPAAAGSLAVETAKGFHKMFAEPSETIQKVEKTLGYTPEQNAPIQNIISTPLRTFGKGVVRSFSWLEGLGKMIAQDIGIATDAYTPEQIQEVLIGKVTGGLKLNAQGEIETEKISPKQQEELNLREYTPLQRIGDITTGALAFYVPSVFGKTAIAVKNMPVLNAITIGGLRGLQVGLEFGVAGELASGQKFNTQSLTNW